MWLLTPAFLAATTFSDFASAATMMNGNSPSDGSARTCLSGGLKGPRRELAIRIQEQVVRIFEACNFQDICGHRISKVVALLKFIEQRLVSMESAWANVVPFTESEAAEVPADDTALLNGPALAGEHRVLQDDIDSLFN